MSNNQIIFDSDYLDTQMKRLAQIRHDIYNVEWGLKRESVLDGIQCRENKQLSDSLDELIKNLGNLKTPIEEIIKVFQHASAHVNSDSEKAKSGADIMVEKMKEKYGMEASSYNPNTVFNPVVNKTVPITPVPALATVIVSHLLVGLDKMPWVKNPTALTLSKTFAAELKETEALEESFENEQVGSISDIIYADKFRYQFRDYLNSLFAEA